MSLNFEAVSSCDLPGVQHFPLLTSPKDLGGASLFWRRKGPILGLGIFAFHSHPQTGGICPVLDSDALSSQAPTDMYHPGREDDKLFLGRICMSSSSPSGSAQWGPRQPEQLNCSPHRGRPTVPLELTSRRCLGQKLFLGGPRTLQLMELCGRPICVWQTASVHFPMGIFGSYNFLQ